MTSLGNTAGVEQLSQHCRRAIGILTPLEHKDKPWIQNITSRLLERDVEFELVDPSESFDPDDDGRFNHLSLLVCLQ